MEQTIDEQRRTYQGAVLLKDFWERADRAKSRLGRLNLLRELANVDLVPDPFIGHDTALSRKHFQRRKQDGAFRLNGWCWVCRQASTDHRHHIIPVSSGGRNRALNIVNLCAPCHRDVHRKATDK